MLSSQISVVEEETMNKRLMYDFKSYTTNFNCLCEYNQWVVITYD